MSLLLLLLRFSTSTTIIINIIICIIAIIIVIIIIIIITVNPPTASCYYQPPVYGSCSSSCEFECFFVQNLITYIQKRKKCRILYGNNEILRKNGNTCRATCRSKNRKHPRSTCCIQPYVIFFKYVTFSTLTIYV